jgi:hypothetical protein
MKDGDCRISDDRQLVLCHYGATHRSPDGLTSGAPIAGADGQRWAYTSDTSDGRAACFTIDKPLPGGSRRGSNVVPFPQQPGQPEPQPAALPIAPQAPIELLRLPGHPTDLVRINPDAPPKSIKGEDYIVEAVYPYSETQAAWRLMPVAGGKKQFRPAHSDGRSFVPGAGKDLWPLWRQEEVEAAAAANPGGWVLETEGEKTTEIAREGGLIAISQPGHAHKVEQIQRRYAAVKAAGAGGIVFLADKDQQGVKRAQESLEAAAAEGLPLVVLPAAEVWQRLPDGGSIDDAPGSPAERVAALLKVLGEIEPGQWAEVWADCRQGVGLAEKEEEEAAADGLTGRITKAALQTFLRKTYTLEFNELTRTCEVDGAPMGAGLHLADSLLAATHGIEVPKQAAMDSFEFVARSNPYNPIHRYLLGLRGRSDLQLIPMVDLGRAFGIHPADDTSHSLLAAHLAGCVLRGIDPGHKHDQLLILSGSQGTGKSTAIEALAPPGMYDSATKVADLENRDTLAKLNAAWLFEFDECEHTLQRSTASEFKGFIARRWDKYAEKYEKESTNHPRRAVPFGTTNHTEVLNDSTGNRRVWIIHTADRPLDPAWITANRDSIWATVQTWIGWGLRNWLSQDDELAIAAATRAEDANLSDPWEGLIAGVLGRHTVDTSGGIAQADLIDQALHLPADKINRDVQMRVARIVTGSAFRTHDGTVRWEQKKRRFDSGSPRSGYKPVWVGHGRAAADPSSVPTGATVPTDSAGVGTAEKPWFNRLLTSPFQPVPTFLLRVNRYKGEGVQGARGEVHGAVASPPPDVGTGWNTPETPVAARLLPVPTGWEAVGSRNGTPPVFVGTAVPDLSPEEEGSRPSQGAQSLEPGDYLADPDDDEPDA